MWFTVCLILQVSHCEMRREQYRCEMSREQCRWDMHYIQ